MSKLKSPIYSAPIGKYAQANLDFQKSAEFATASDPTTLGAPDVQRRYLENRLLEAFRLGIRRGEQIAADRITRLALGQQPSD